MPPLRDEHITDRLQIAFDEWHSGGVLWLTVPTEWVGKNLEGCTPAAINDLVTEHIRRRGKINVAENKTEFRNLHSYHYEFRLLICGRHIYVETILDEIKMGPRVTVVSVHD